MACKEVMVGASLREQGDTHSTGKLIDSDSVDHGVGKQEGDQPGIYDISWGESGSSKCCTLFSYQLRHCSALQSCISSVFWADMVKSSLVWRSKLWYQTLWLYYWMSLIYSSAFHWCVLSPTPSSSSQNSISQIMLALKSLVFSCLNREKIGHPSADTRLCNSANEQIGYTALRTALCLTCPSVMSTNHSSVLQCCISRIVQNLFNLKFYNKNK